VNPRRKPKHHSPNVAAQSLPEACKITRILTRLRLANGSKYDQQATCCGALAFSEPEKSQAQIKKIIESAYDFGAEMIVTPCPVCQMNVEVYQGQINTKYGKVTRSRWCPTRS
jgi:heterodisulfide reductase subunit B